MPEPVTPDPIVVYGSGPAGAALVLAFSRRTAEFRAALVRRGGAGSSPKRHAEARYIALHEGSRNLLTQLRRLDRPCRYRLPDAAIRITDTSLEDFIRPDLLGFVPGDETIPLAHLVPWTACSLSERCLSSPWCHATAHPG